METEKELNARISRLTGIVREKFPELLKDINNMPPKPAPYSSPMNQLEKLRAYYDSISMLLSSHIHQFTNHKY